MFSLSERVLVALVLGGLDVVLIAVVLVAVVLQ
jgi:hypothetical protein